MGMEDRQMPAKGFRRTRLERNTRVAGGNIAIECSHLVPITSLRYRQLKICIGVHNVCTVKPLVTQELLSGNRWC